MNEWICFSIRKNFKIDTWILLTTIIVVVLKTCPQRLLTIDPKIFFSNLPKTGPNLVCSEKIPSPLVYCWVPVLFFFFRTDVIIVVLKLPQAHDHSCFSAGLIYRVCRERRQVIFQLAKHGLGKHYCNGYLFDHHVAFT